VKKKGILLTSVFWHTQGNQNLPKRKLWRTGTAQASKFG